MYDHDAPHKQTLPGNWDADLNDDGVPFERLCILRCLRPDRVIPMVTDFVTTLFGAQYTEPPPFSLEECFADSSPLSPLIFILSPGQVSTRRSPLITAHHRPSPLITNY